jgi:phosphate acetyltransferase
LIFLESIRQRARERPRTIVFPEGEDPRTLASVAVVQEERLLDPILLGPEEKVREGVKAAGGDAEAVRIIDPADPSDGSRAECVREFMALRRARKLTEAQAEERVSDPLTRGAMMVRMGAADGSVAGAVYSTADVLRAGIWCIGSADGIRSVSSSFYMVLPSFRGSSVLTFTDGAVIPDPTPAQLAEIAVAASRARRKVVGDEPIVAFLSYSTLGSAQGPAVDKVRSALNHFREIEPDVRADGEFQADTALVEEVARRKAPGSEIGGHANVLVFPNLDAANIGYKLVQRLAGAEAIGPIIQGLRRPCNDLSRGSNVEDIVNVACITSLMAEAS